MGKRIWIQFSRRVMIAAILVVGALLGVGVAIYLREVEEREQRRIEEAEREATLSARKTVFGYVTKVVVLHQEWPKSWEDICKKSECDALRQYVTVDFKVSLEELYRSNEDNFTAIQTANERWRKSHDADDTRALLQQIDSTLHMKIYK